MEMEFLAKRYAVMQALAEADDGGSCKSFQTNRSSVNKVKQWLNVQVVPTSEVASGEKLNPTIVPSNTKPTTDDQLHRKTNSSVPECSTKHVQPVQSQTEVSWLVPAPALVPTPAPEPTRQPFSGQQRTGNWQTEWPTVPSQRGNTVRPQTGVPLPLVAYPGPVIVQRQPQVVSSTPLQQQPTQVPQPWTQQLVQQPWTQPQVQHPLPPLQPVPQPLPSPQVQQPLLPPQVQQPLPPPQVQQPRPPPQVPQPWTQPQVQQPLSPPQVQQPRPPPQVPQSWTQPQVQQPLPPLQVQQPRPPPQVPQPWTQPQVQQPLSPPQVQQPRPPPQVPQSWTQPQVQQPLPPLQVQQPRPLPQVPQPWTQTQVQHPLLEPYQEELLIKPGQVRPNEVGPQPLYDVAGQYIQNPAQEIYDSTQNTPPLNTHPPSNLLRQHYGGVTCPSQQPGSNMIPRYGPLPTDTVPNNQTPHVRPSLAPVAAGAHHLYGPNAQQLQARNVVSKELPVFNGDPSDWPIFITSYNNSTQICGYSDYENLMRLQRCIQGKAREAVKSFLLHPSTLPQVLSTLYMLYGRPELIANTLLAKARSTPAPKADKLDTLIEFGLVVQNLCAHLQAVGLDNHLKNPTFLQELVDKLPSNIRLEWALYQSRVEAPDLATFSNFMTTLVTAVSQVVSPVTFVPDPRGEKRKDKAYVNTHAVTGNASTTTEEQSSDPKPCPVCNKVGHKTKNCFEFRKLDVDARWKTVQQHHLCRGCLTLHGKRPCRTDVCGIDGCEHRHHRLLHAVKSNSESKQETKPTSVGTVSLHSEGNSTALFRVLPVTLYGKNIQVNTYAFLDDGSELSLMDKELAKKLNVDGELQPLCMQWTSGVTRAEPDSQVVQLRISGRGMAKEFALNDVHTVSSLKLPMQTMVYSELRERFQHLQGLPVEDYQHVTPQILIGLNNTGLCASLKIREGEPGEPVAARTRLGWMVYGSLPGSKTFHGQRYVHVCSRASEDELHNLVQSFFDMEGTGVRTTPLLESKDIQRARAILEETTIRTSTGRFETGLLWRSDYIEFPDSLVMAERRLACLERQLSTKPKVYENIRQQLKDYQLKGYAHIATEEELQSSDPRRVWYLPLGFVQNPKKPAKVRIIWDAAAKADKVSFNSMILKGPDLLTSLPGVLSRFRQRQVAVSGDIKEMFHQVLIREADRQSQRFLWRDDPSQPVDTYVMDVAIFGSACSPCSSQFVKNLNAKEHENTFPRAATAIIRHHYVDDYLDSFDSTCEAIAVANEVKLVHGIAGFEIRNWLSNKPEVVDRIGSGSSESVRTFTFDKGNECERVLGISWIPIKDVFKFSLVLRDDLQGLLEENTVPTKRQILQVVMSVFDPLGLVSMLVIHGKIIIQEVWKSGTGWDDAISPSNYVRWQRWTEALSHMKEITIPRCYFPGYRPNSYDTLELHIFVDASEEAFACVGYFRIIDRQQVRCALVSSKSKVAPVKAVSIPRLELQAAVIGTRLAKSIAENHDLRIHRRVFWTDSTTVLAWIRSDHRRYKPYVAFRISEILSETSVAEWKWVPSGKNVADEATKWQKEAVYDESSRWFTAPEFLYEDEERWPQQKQLEAETCEELRVVHHHRAAVVTPLVQFERFSKFERLVRAVAYVHLFGDCCRSKTNSKQLSREHLQLAEAKIFQAVQEASYPDEVAVLRKNQGPVADRVPKIDKSSTLYQLSPFMDELGVIRMESRIANALCVPYETRNPVILPRNHRVTALMIDFYHRRYGHSSNEAVVNEIRQKYRVPGLRAALRQVIKDCMWCRVYKSKTRTPRMSPLPIARLSPHVRAFTFVGLDYCGPFLIKINRSSVKRWIALFCCMTVRAVHLEVVHSLTTESCKLAIRRFISYRGSPQEIYSDQGTNFVGARRELAESLQNVNQALSETFTNTCTQWHLNPPAAPHMGGAWERLVRSVKSALAALMLPKKPNEETFATFVAEAASMVNSRPLTYVPLEDDCQESLTPNHFLLLSSSGVVQPPKQPTSDRDALRCNWNQIQNLLDQFWNRWIIEYLPVIARRGKWIEDVEPIRVGDLVVIVDEAVRNSWTRGRVERVYQGKDGRIRRADVLTNTGVFQRPVTKLAVLDLANRGIAGSGHQQYGAGNVASEPRWADAAAVISDDEAAVIPKLDDATDSAGGNESVKLVTHNTTRKNT